MFDAVAQNCAKTEGPTIKMNKTNFEVHGPRSKSNLLTLIYVFKKYPQFDRQILQKSHISGFSKKWNRTYFKAKNVCDKSLKIKTLRWQSSCIFWLLRQGILRFFLGAIFMERFLNQIKTACWKIFKKVGKVRFYTAKFAS